MNSFIPYGKQSINQDDIENVKNILESDWLTTGPSVEKFEAKLSNYCKAKYGVAVSNATSALHLSCLALGVTTGDYVWTSPNSFLASANCALYCGANIDFVDICPITYNLSIKNLEVKLKEAQGRGKLPKVIIPVHFAGQSCHMVEISKLSQEYGFKIIEDASHALGASYRDSPVGSCKYSDITVFSFHPVKIITTGEGGIALTNQKNISDRINNLRNHGMIRDIKKDEPWYYEQQELGFNYRITDFQCALGISQLKRLDSFVAKRNYLANRYNELLSNLPFILPKVERHNYSSFHLYVIQIDKAKTKISRLELFNKLRQSNIGINVHYIPIHTQPYYQKKYNFKSGDFPVSESYYKQAVTLPLYPELKEEEQSYIVKKLQGILNS